MNVVGAAPKRWLFYGAMISQYNYPFDGSPALRRSRSKLAEEVGAIRISLLWGKKNMQNTSRPYQSKVNKINKKNLHVDYSIVRRLGISIPTTNDLPCLKLAFGLDELKRQPFEVLWFQEIQQYFAAFIH